MIREPVDVVNKIFKHTDLEVKIDSNPCVYGSKNKLLRLFCTPENQTVDCKKNYKDQEIVVILEQLYWPGEIIIHSYP